MVDDCKEIEVEVSSDIEVCDEDIACDVLLISSIPIPPLPPAPEPELPAVAEEAEQPVFAPLHDLSVNLNEAFWFVPVSEADAIADHKAEQSMDFYFIAGNVQALHYTYLPAATSLRDDCENADACISDASSPFLPGSTFYFPTHDLKQGSQMTVEL